MRITQAVKNDEGIVKIETKNGDRRPTGNSVAGDGGIIAGQAMEERLEAMPPNQSAHMGFARR